VSSRDPSAPGPFDGAVRRPGAASPPGSTPTADAAPVHDGGWGLDDPQDWDPEVNDEFEQPGAATPGRRQRRPPHVRGRGGHRFAYAIIGLLGAASLVCVLLLGARSWYSHTYHYWFLLWNLALAWVPFVFAGLAYSLAPARRAYLWVLVVLSAVVWLAFFPNAPYILTDFLHLGSMGDIVPGWYDVLMLYWFAWTGLMLGIVSLYLMQEIVARGLGAVAGWVFVVVVAGVGSLGIYLGRFLRWNSWDIVRRPGPLADALLGRFTDPHSQPRLLGFTALFALLFLFIYVAVYIFAKFTKPPEGRDRA
jgi:uncharacterized membrane protein